MVRTRKGKMSPIRIIKAAFVNITSNDITVIFITVIFVTVIFAIFVTLIFVVLLWHWHGTLTVPVKVHNVLVVSLEVGHRAESLPAGGLLLYDVLIVHQHHFIL